MADEAEVAGEVRERATGHGFPIRKLLEKEEDEGNSLPSLARPGRGSRSTLHGRRPWSSSEHAASTVEGTKSREN